MDYLIFRSIRMLVGGRVRAIMSGGAPLAPDTHDYLKSVLGCPILQGYGLTETSACAAIMRMDENVTGTVGPPVQGVQIQVCCVSSAVNYFDLKTFQKEMHLLVAELFIISIICKLLQDAIYGGIKVYEKSFIFSSRTGKKEITV